MVRYSLTDLGNKSGEVAEAAFAGPVEITKRGKRKFVLMTAEKFDQLSGKSSQRVHTVDNLSDEEKEFFLAGLDEIASEYGDD